jgi:hypothetical protein
MSGTHKIYVDSRARVNPGTTSHNKFVWQAPRPINVPNCRAFIDSVHLPVAWGTFHGQNQYVYISEQLDGWNVGATNHKLYLYETYGTSESIRVASIAQFPYTTGAAFASAVQAALQANSIIPGAYTVAHSGSGQGTLTITHAAAASEFSLNIANREDLGALSTWGATAISPTALQDACGDILGLRTSGVASTLPNNGSLALTLGSAQLYRKIALDIGGYDASSLQTMVTTKLNSGTSMATYTATVSGTTNRMTIATNSAKTFQLWSGEYLDAHPYAFQGHTNGGYAYDIIGFRGGVQEGSSSAPLVGQQHINVQCHHTIFINSSMGFHNHSIGPLGQTTIARKVVIDQPPGGMVNDYHSSLMDYVSIPAGDIHQISFRLTDWEGKDIDMDVAWSMSIIFVAEHEF